MAATIMDYTDIYSLLLGGIVTCLLLLRLARLLFHTYLNHIRPFLLTRVAYPRYITYITWTYPLRAIFLTSYIAMTVGFNAIGVHTISEASSRAAKLSLLNLVPLFICSHECGAHFLGISRDIYRILHKIIGIVAFLEAFTHMVLQGVICIVKSQQVNLRDTATVCGVTSIALLTSIFVLSVFKSRLYELFLKLHILFALALPFFIWKHVVGRSSMAIQCLYGSALVYGVTLSFQLARILYRNITPSRRGKCIIKSRGHSVIIHITPARSWKVRAGQRINICVPGASILSIFQMHTFVIAWWDDEDQEPQSISLLVQPRSGLTSKFHELHMTGKYFTLIDGPYGPDNSGGMIRDLGDYGHLFMVATGIGIAAQIPYIKELLEAQRYGLVRTQRITLIWQSDMTQDYDGARDWIQQLVTQDSGYKLTVSLFDTSRRASPKDPRLHGEHKLIRAWGGEADWEQKLLEEMDVQIGTMLITVSAQRHIRSDFRRLALKHRKRNVELFELEFQPWGSSRSWWSYL